MLSSPVTHFRLGNAVTYLGIAAALVAILLTTGPESRSLAGAALAAAALADLFDGRFARLFPRTEEQKRFGVQIDSLADALSFGVAPVVVLAHVVPGGASSASFACGFVYVLCAVTRLAYYNVTEGENPGFVGVPTTLLGAFWSLWLLRAPTLWATDCALLVGGLAMVAPIRIARPGAKTFIAVAIITTALVVVHGMAAVLAGSAGTANAAATRVEKH